MKEKKEGWTEGERGKEGGKDKARNERRRKKLKAHRK